MSRWLDVVMPVHGQAELTIRCWESLEEWRDQLRVLWVDNASPARDLQRLTESASAMSYRVDLLTMPGNEGFVKATNEGLRDFLDGDATHVLLLNNDTALFPGCLETLRDVVDHRPGIAGPISTSGWQSWKRCRSLLPVAVWEQLARARGDEARARVLRSVADHWYEPPRNGQVAFFCAMLDRGTVETVGLLDEAFGLGFGEDDDYNERAKRAGLDVSLALGAYVWHRHRTTWTKLHGRKRYEAMQMEAAEVFRRKWGRLPWE